MPNQKKQLQHKPKFIEIPRFRLIAGLVLGLFYAIIFYLFLYLSREGFRIISVTEYYDMWILTDSEVHFYNLIFAFIAVIWGQSICFSFWLDRPRRMFDILNRRRVTIVNDQRVLNWNFLNWFIKVAVVFGIMFGLAFHAGFYTFSFYPTYSYIFILMVVVLFLQTWNTIRQTIKGKSLRWMLVSLVIVSTMSWGLSRVNAIDYKAINNSYLQYNIQHSYNLDVPESSAFERLRNLSLLEDIYIVESKKPKAEPIIVMNNNEIAFEDLGKRIENLQEMYGKSFFPSVVFQLHINNTVKMGFLNKIKGELSTSGVSRIAYAVVPANHRYDKRYYHNFCFPMRLPAPNNGLANQNEVRKRLQEISNTIAIKVDSSNSVLVNGSKLNPTNLKQTIEQSIKRDPNYIIKLSIDDNSDFSTYFKVLSSSKEAVDELRNEYSVTTYLKQFNQLDVKETREVEKRYPFRISELISE